MATIKIEPISTTTVSGYPARITGINTDPKDCFAGEVDAPSGTIFVEWDINGLANGQHSGCNLSTTTVDFKDAKEALEFLNKIES